MYDFPDAKMTHRCAHGVATIHACIPCGRSASNAKPLAQPQQFDEVNRPRHYNQGGVECIDAMIAAFGMEAVQTYCRLNAFKYQWRADHKGKARQDLEKAVWYLRFAMGDDPRK